MTVNYQPSIVQYFWTSIGLIFTPRTCIVFIRLSALPYYFGTLSVKHVTQLRRNTQVSPDAAHPPSSPCRYRQLPERAAAQNRHLVGPTACPPLVVLLNLVNSRGPGNPVATPYAPVAPAAAYMPVAPAPRVCAPTAPLIPLSPAAPNMLVCCQCSRQIK